MNPEDTGNQGLAAFDATQQGLAAAAQDADQSDEEVQDADSDEGSQEEEVLYAGKYRTVEALEGAYQEIQRFAGGRKELEDKAARYDRLVAAQAQSAGQEAASMPKLGQFIQGDGTIDVTSYDAKMEKWQSHLISTAAQAGDTRAREQADLSRAETAYPYLVTDEVAAKSVIALYRSGGAASITEAAYQIDKLRGSSRDAGVKEGEALARHELSKKSRSGTERPSAKTGSSGGEMTEAKFKGLTRDEQSAYVNARFKDGAWGTPS